MKELSDAHEKLGHSRAIFKLVLNTSRSEVELDPVNKYVPTIEVNANPIEMLIVESFYERFNKDMLRFEKDDNITLVYRTIEKRLRSLYEEHSSLKNPKQSSTFKWLLNLDGYNTPSGDGIVMLYKYIISAAEDPNDPDEVTFEGGSNNPHVRNFLAILEKMRHKYEKK